MTTSINPYSGLGMTTLETATTTAKKSLGQDEFLKLMTTQMTHQDPTKPMQNGEFLSQMAQFGTVNGIQDLQKSFKEFSASISSDQALQAASLVGRKVSVASKEGVLEAGGAITGSFDLPASSTSVKVKITDLETGRVLKIVSLGEQPAGPVAFKWDGFNEAGTLASPGTYGVQPEAYLDGKNTALQANIDSRVNSVSMGTGTGGVKVNLYGLGQVSFNQIKQVSGEF
jgi:flagellar basal-body rod modification protein FlgD